MKNNSGKPRPCLPLVRGIVLFIALALHSGCLNETFQPTSDSNSSQPIHLERLPDTSGCTSTTGILQINQNLTLFSRNSEARYQSNSVLLPTLVSFSICELETPAFNISSRVAVLGPLPLLQLLRPMEVRLDFVDAGLPGNTRDSSFFRLYRQNEITGGWDFVLLDQVHSSEVRYEVTQFGKYAVGLVGAVIDTTWNVIALVPPTGGTLNLLTSRLVIPNGALDSTRTISFRITNASPQGLPGSTNRVFDFGPDGTAFQVPVTLYVSFQDAGMEGEKVRPLRFYYYNTSTSSWEIQPTEVDWRTGELVVTLSHFSRYAFGR